MRISSVAKTVAAVGSLVAALICTEQVAAQKAPVCVAKMTQGRLGGDHRIVFAVRSDKVADLEARGFVRTDCGQRKQFAKIRQEMCEVSARSTPAIEADFKRVYSVTPSEVCELSNLDR
jgi:hypothetical protein